MQVGPRDHICGDMYLPDSLTLKPPLLTRCAVRPVVARRRLTSGRSTQCEWPPLWVAGKAVGHGQPQARLWCARTPGLCALCRACASCAMFVRLSIQRGGVVRGAVQQRRGTLRPSVCGVARVVPASGKEVILTDAQHTWLWTDVAKPQVIPQG